MLSYCDRTTLTFRLQWAMNIELQAFIPMVICRIVPGKDYKIVYCVQSVILNESQHTAHGVPQTSVMVEQATCTPYTDCTRGGLGHHKLSAPESCQHREREITAAE